MSQVKVPLRDWLSGSRVLGADGRPLVLYHGSNNIFNDFELNDSPLVRGSLRGFYFTSDKQAALEYGETLYVVFVNLKNPFIGCPFSGYRDIHGIELPGFGSPPEVFAKHRSVTPSAVKEWLIDQGYDGVIIPAYAKYVDHDEIIAFDNKQVRIMKTMTAQPEISVSHGNVIGP